MQASVLYSGKGPLQWLKRVARDRRLDRQDRKRVDDLEQRRAQLRQKYAELSRTAQTDEEEESLNHDHREEDEPLFDQIERIETDAIRRWADRWNVEIPASSYDASYLMNGYRRSQLAKRIKDERYKWLDPRIKLALTVVGLLLATITIFFNDNIRRWWSPQPAEVTRDNVSPPAQSASNAPQGRPERTPAANQSPTGAQEPRISQSSTGDNSPNIVAGPNSNVTISPAPNPNAPTITYDFDGTRRETRLNPLVVDVVTDTPEAKAISEFWGLQDRKDWQGMMELSDRWIAKSPEWLAPPMFKATALIQVGQIEVAVELLRRIERRAAGNESYREASRILNSLKERGLIK